VMAGPVVGPSAARQCPTSSRFASRRALQPSWPGSAEQSGPNPCEIAAAIVGRLSNREIRQILSPPANREAPPNQYFRQGGVGGRLVRAVFMICHWLARATP